MNNIACDKDIFNLQNMDKNQYVVSLIKSGMKMGKLENEGLMRIQLELMELLKEHIMDYTNGESSSVTVETTESLMNSILYGLDFYLLRINDHQQALEELKEKNMKSMYENALIMLQDYVRDTKQLYLRTKRDRLKVEVEAYNSTIDEGIEIFFQKYNIVFSAHNAMASIDYPLVFDDMRVRGISYMGNYLENLNIETKFCKLFSEETINKLLEGFGRLCRLNHRIELINIFEVLLNNSIFSGMCGKNADELFISYEEFYQLNKRIINIDVFSVNLLVDKAVEKIIIDMKIEDKKLIDYITSYKELFKKRISNALKNNCLNSLVVIEQAEAKKCEFTFDNGQRMEDAAFKKIINKLLEAGNIEEKIDIIDSEINSLQDFIDMLEGDCIFENEYMEIFKALGDIELTILTKIVFYEELRDFSRDFRWLLSMGDSSMKEEWKRYFTKFLESLDEKKVKNIEKLINEVDYEEIKFY
ncbi:hypothetical protein IAI10_09150 [Clostridium sp. 19966]|uniref:DUF6179 domain-containing protein n=1 Tax=Clostridium sp. 19966 TaxID=2768166 RepID=UPI0028DE358E|nr:DUF6179 domain-containing protein [Clostridium sp. 19966]MDT8716824.1 hypothetical protein [Clostridium sp. 19966]